VTGIIESQVSESEEKSEIIDSLKTTIADLSGQVDKWTSGQPHFKYRGLAAENLY